MIVGKGHCCFQIMFLIRTRVTFNSIIFNMRHLSLGNHTDGCRPQGNMFNLFKVDWHENSPKRLNCRKKGISVCSEGDVKLLGDK